MIRSWTSPMFKMSLQILLGKCPRHSHQGIDAASNINFSAMFLGEPTNIWEVYGFFLIKKILTLVSESEVAQSCPTLCDPIDCSLPGFSVYGIFQARVLEWVTIFFSRRSSRPRDWTWVSCIIGRHFTVWATREVSTNDWIVDKETSTNFSTLVKVRNLQDRKDVLLLF